MPGAVFSQPSTASRFDPMRYKVIQFDGSAERMEAVLNEWSAKGYEIFQIIERSTYDWRLVFRKADGEAAA